MASASTDDSSRPGKLSSTVSPTPSFPFAASPDIIRANQKDLYFTSNLHTQLSDVIRQLYGSRLSHKFHAEIETVTSLLYFALTTLIGNRTLGEEYTDIYQVEADSGSFQKLPSIRRRAGYITFSVLLPYFVGRILPAARSRIRAILEAKIERSQDKRTLASRIRAYLLANLGSVTSPAPIHALTLAFFYFTGRYYHLGKRIFGLRYIFSRRLTAFEQQQRVGYEVLGVLLVIQMTAQIIGHVYGIAKENAASESGANTFEGQHSGNRGELLPESSGSNIANTDGYRRLRAALTTHTPFVQADEARYDLQDSSKLAWLQPEQQRKCTLCLEFMKDPSVTTCGHVFCWTCILDWIREKPECPLCRQHVLGQHVLPLRG